MVQWERGRVLGHGGSGTVYQCSFSEGRRPVQAAVKEVSKTGLSAQQCRVIETEIELLKTFAHPNVIQYLGTEYTSSHFYIFLEYAECGSLRQIYLKQGALSDAVIVFFLKQVLNGLLYLHLRGVAHRDVKGANILITSDGVAKLADFGSSKKIIMESLVSGIKGTPHFMAPEVIKGTQEETGWYKADIWAVGCLVVELHLAALPYSAKYENSMTVMFKVASGEKPSTGSDASSPNLSAFVDHCCEIEPRSRPSVEDLLADPFLEAHDVNQMHTMSEVLTMVSYSNDSFESAEEDGFDEEEEQNIAALQNKYPSFAGKSPSAVARIEEISTERLSPKTRSLQPIKTSSPARIISGNADSKTLETDSDALSYSASIQAAQGERPPARMTGQMFRMGSDSLVKAGLGGSAAVRKSAKEEVDRSSHAAQPALGRSRPRPQGSGRSQSADVIIKVRSLPPLSSAADSVGLRHVQTAPALSSKTLRAAPVQEPLTPKAQGRRSMLPRRTRAKRGVLSPPSIIAEEEPEHLAIL